MIEKLLSLLTGGLAVKGCRVTLEPTGSLSYSLAGDELWVTLSPAADVRGTGWLTRHLPSAGQLSHVRLTREKATLFVALPIIGEQQYEIPIEELER